MDTTDNYSQNIPKPSYSSSKPVSNDEDYRLPRRDPPVAKYSSARDPRQRGDPRQREEPQPDEYVPSTIDKYMKSNMSKDEVLEKLKADLFKSNESPVKSAPPSRAPQRVSPPNRYRSPSPQYPVDDRKRDRYAVTSPPLPSGRVFGDSQDALPVQPNVPKLPNIDYTKLIPSIPPELQISGINAHMPAHLPPELVEAVSKPAYPPPHPPVYGYAPRGRPQHRPNHSAPPPRGPYRSGPPGRGRGGPPSRGGPRGGPRGGNPRGRGFRH